MEEPNDEQPDPEKEQAGSSLTKYEGKDLGGRQKAGHKITNKQTLLHQEIQECTKECQEIKNLPLNAFNNYKNIATMEKNTKTAKVCPAEDQPAAND